ncbi:Uncharacterised protein [Klebsiella pneumoniae]|uniref:Uncharacterized protein n=1 Tax=Klebsiella pneumoniae TaxID=573 RepID=A0A377VA31_KLEPN|nr:Uncharacterised protein [Klebsiella pneumoniae]
MILCQVPFLHQSVQRNFSIFTYYALTTTISPSQHLVQDHLQH